MNITPFSGRITGLGTSKNAAAEYQYAPAIGSNAPTASSTTQFTNEPNAQTLMPNMTGPCTAQNLSVVITAAPGSSGVTNFTRTFTLRSSSAPTYPSPSTAVITCTITNPGTTCNSGVTTGTFAANDKVSIEASYTDLSGTAATAADGLFGWECQK